MEGTSLVVEEAVTAAAVPVAVDDVLEADEEVALEDVDDELEGLFMVH